MLITLKAVFLLVATVVVAGNDLGIAVVVHGILNRFVGRVHGLGCSDNLGCTGVFRLGWKGILLVTFCGLSNSSSDSTEQVFGNVEQFVSNNVHGCSGCLSK